MADDVGRWSDELARDPASLAFLPLGADFRGQFSFLVAANQMHLMCAQAVGQGPLLGLLHRADSPEPFGWCAQAIAIVFD